MPDDTPPLILASASPRRAELLASAGFSFTVLPADVDESVHPGERPETYVVRVAEAKANAVFGRQEDRRISGNPILGADTAVVLEGEILGKAETPPDAFRMLKRLSGAVHSVYTGVVLVCGDRQLSDVVQTRVHFLPITDDEIHAYVATGEPLGKAGGYAIQGRAARFVDWIDGSWSNVVGLPLATVHAMLERIRQ
jgi:septum formation protein